MNFLKDLVVGTRMFSKASTFLKSTTLPLVDTMKPRIVPKKTIMHTYLGLD